MTLLRRLIFQNLIWRVLFYISVLVQNIFIARYFLAAHSGSLFFLANFFALLLVFFSFCLETGMGYYLASDRISAGKLTLFSIVWSLLIGLICTLTMGILFKLSSVDISKSNFAFISLTFIIGNLLITYFSALFYAKRNFITPYVILIIVNIGVVALIPMAKVNVYQSIFESSFAKIYFSSFLIQGLLLFAIFSFKYVSVRTVAILTRSELKLLMIYSVWAFATSLISFLLFRIDYWFVNKYCSPVELGNYIQTSKIVQIFLVLPSIFSSTVFPLIAGGATNQMKDVIQTLSRIIFFVTSCFCLIGLLFGHWLFPAIFGSGFNLMHMVFVLLVPGMLIFCSISPITAYFAGRKILHVNFVASLIALLITLAGNIIFVPIYKIAGAAIISSLGYIVYAFMLMRYFVKETQSTYSGFFFLKASDLLWMRHFVSKQVRRQI
ncbi:MAG: hypothetical protein C5B59_19180 [Bacteroidetes bacterium]|nr:MAG: hypothetical protein C5B59_19180 [Bacteroidota bacterium]